MTAAKRPVAGITNLELEQVAHLTYQDAANIIGVAASTIRDLYQTRGVIRKYRRPGQIAEYRTRAPYPENHGRKGVMSGSEGGVLGLYGNGDRVKMFWAEMDEAMAKRLGLEYACPCLGMEECLTTCELGEDCCLDGCDFKCNRCRYETVCPCLRYSWQARQK